VAIARPVARRRLLGVAARWGMRLTCAGMLAAGYATEIEPQWVEVTTQRMRLREPAPAFAGYRIAQISDLHMGDWLDRAHLADVVRRVSALGADLIAITGDFVTRHPERVADELIAELRGLRARDGVVAVLGNHDHWSDAGIVREILRSSGVRELRNRAITLERGGMALHIAGVDDYWERQDRLDDVVAALPRGGAAVLLAHEPDYADVSTATGRFDLQISGHSHGGQIVLPGHGPIRLPPYGRKYPLGRYTVGGMTLYTNRGVGMLRPHVRINCRPEITLFELEAG